MGESMGSGRRRVAPLACLAGALAVACACDSGSGGGAGEEVASVAAAASATDPWRAAPALSVARGKHATALLDDGRIMVVGGEGAGGAQYPLAAEIFDPVQATWTPTGPLAAGREWLTATTLPDGRVLVAGGQRNWVKVATAELYDPQTGTWSPAAPMKVARAMHSATLLYDGRVLVTGGSRLSGAEVAEIYDPATNTWSPGGAMARPSFWHTSTTLPGGKVLAVGGWADGEPTGAELYDPETNAWASAGAMLEGRYKHSVTPLADGRLLIAGGRSDADQRLLQSAELYDPATGSWAVAAPLGVARAGHGAALSADGRVVVAGGVGASGAEASAEAYDPSLAQWAPAAPMPAGRSHFGFLPLPGGTFLAAGGLDRRERPLASNLDFAAAPRVNYQSSTLAEGEGWSLVRVQGLAVDEGGVPFDHPLYRLNGQVGREQSPLSPFVKAELAEDPDFQDDEAFVSAWVADEIEASLAAGALTPALEAIAEPPDEDEGEGGARAFGLFGKCKSKNEHRAKSTQFVAPFSRSTDFGGGFTGKLEVSGDMRGRLDFEIDLQKKRTKVFGACITVGYRLLRTRVSGSAALEQGATVRGTPSFSKKWATNVLDRQVARYAFFIGPVPVYVPVSLLVDVGLDFEASVTASATYNAKQAASGSFDYACERSAGCTGTTNFDLDGFREPQAVVGSVSARVKPSPWAQVSGRVALYDDDFASVQLGIRPYLLGDVWLFTGNDCGDADGDGLNEHVSAATVGLDWRVAVRGRASFLDNATDKELFSTAPRNLLFRDLAPGGSSALTPIIAGPATVAAGQSGQYRLSMRPCWPYGDAVDYAFHAGDGASVAVSGAPGTPTPVPYAWAAPGVYEARAEALRDAHGRRLGASTTRPVEVTAAPPPPAGSWTDWLNRDTPSSAGDFETLADFLASGQACPAPLAIECRTRTGGVDWAQAGEVYQCTPAVGGVCRNDEQPDGACLDYEVRFLCP